MRKSRRRGALGEQKQPKLADWLIRLEKPSNNVERMAAGKPDHTEEQMDRHKGISTYEDKPNQNEPDTNQIEIGQPDTKFEDSQPTPSSRSEMKNEKANCIISKKGFCQTHSCLTNSVTVTSKKWRDRGGGRGFGFVQTKVKKFVCKAKNLSTRSPDIIPGSDNMSSTDNPVIRGGQTESESELEIENTI